MTFAILLHQLTSELRTLVRKIENLMKKISNCETAVSFNNTCLRENLLPKYTHIRLHDQAAQNASFTRNYRRNLVELQLQNKKDELQRLRQELNAAKEEWGSRDVEPVLRDSVDAALRNLDDQHRSSAERCTLRKLVVLNGGNLKVARPKKGYINLSDVELSAAQEELLDLGLNCHILSKPRPHEKRLEIEVLLDDIQQLEKKKTITTTGPALQAELLAEAGKRRGHHKSSILRPELKEAAKQLRNNKDITVRRADKASAYVILPTEEYLQKLDVLLDDATKFMKIRRNPVEDLKKRVNKEIETVNAKAGGLKLSKLSGDYGLGYLYGNVKTHKPGNPLRPIISQIPTPTYKLAKRLADLLTPYVPNLYSLRSSADFLELIQTAPADGMIASLDVESLFTNVPVDTTIQYILDRVYRNPTTPKLDIPEKSLQSLLMLCTKEAPFLCPRGSMYVQTDGVAMGSPLGVLFANFFMGTVEEMVFQDHPKPRTYCRYVDDTFVIVEDDLELQELRRLFEEKSGLRFTTEKSVNGSLPFLDVLLRPEGERFSTSVYVKATNTGHCLNGQSECPQRYLETTVGAFVRRALTHCSSWRSTHQELERVSQVLVNNGYSNHLVARISKRILDNWYEGHTTSTPEGEPAPTKLFYKSHMSSAHKTDERILKEIINRNIKTSNNSKLHIIIYYKSRRTSNLLLQNNSSPKPSDLQSSHLVYSFSCQHDDCAHHKEYIGMTTTRLSRRLTCHLQGGAPKHHYHSKHRAILTRNHLEKGTVILAKENDARRLSILEAIIIKEKRPEMNLQVDDLQALPSARQMSTYHEVHDPTNDVTDSTLPT